MRNAKNSLLPVRESSSRVADLGSGVADLGSGVADLVAE